MLILIVSSGSKHPIHEQCCNHATTKTGAYKLIDPEFFGLLGGLRFN